jgi:hypothetical protein
MSLLPAVLLSGPQERFAVRGQCPVDGRVPGGEESVNRVADGAEIVAPGNTAAWLLALLVLSFTFSHVWFLLSLFLRRA